MGELYELRMRKDLENRFLLVGVKPYYFYENDKKTDKVAGHVYDVLPASDKTIGVKSIKVPGQAVVSMAAIAEKDIYVGFENVTFTPYYNNRTHKKEVSIKADKVVKA